MTEQEFSKIVSSTKRAVLGAIRSHLAPALRHSIDDVAQEVYLRIFNFIQKKGDAALKQESLGSFAYTIARNESLRFNQKNNLNHSPLEEGILHAYKITLTPESNETLLSLEAAINQLGPDLKMVAHMTVQGFRQSEIAEKLAIPEGTVKSRMHKTRQLLQEKLEGVYE